MKQSIKALMLPAPIDGGFKMDNYWVWCSSVIVGEDGKYHMFASRWKKTQPMHPGWLLGSEIVRAVSDTPEGPFTFCEVILPPRGAQYWDGRSTHNPRIIKTNGKYVLYYMGTTHPFSEPSEGEVCDCNDPRVITARANKRIGIAVAESIFGPWKRYDKPILDTRPEYFDNFLTSNPSPCLLKDGKILMMYKARSYIEPPYNRQLHLDMKLAMAVADNFDSEYKRLCDTPLVFGGAELEDPFIWEDEDGINMCAKDMTGKICGEIGGGIHAISKDFINWDFDREPFWSRDVLWEDGKVRRMGNMERPFILFQNNKPTHIYFAVSDGKPGFAECNNTWNMVIKLKS